MTNENGARTTGGPTRGGGERIPDPHGLYRQWFGVLGGARGGEGAGAIDPDEFREMWRRWFEALAGAHSGAAAAGKGFEGGMAPLWEEMAKDISAKMLSKEPLPEEPFAFFLRWYEATSEKWSEMAEELVKDGEALKAGRRFMEDQARSHEELRRASEKVLGSLQIPTRSDVARVALLVRQLEEKFDAFEEAFEESVNGLGARMDRLEGSIERLLAVLENAPQNGALRESALRESAGGEGKASG